MNKVIAILSMALYAGGVVAQKDTIFTHVNYDEVVVVSSPKEVTRLSELPSSVTSIGKDVVASQKIKSIKNVSSIVPNFFMPDYGSRLTSAVYVRGIGSRINTPAVGLYIDGVPYIDKSAFDFNLLNVESITVLSGPQGTLYGRNTMGGVILVNTVSPVMKDAVYVSYDFTTGDNHRKLTLASQKKYGSHFAMSSAKYFERSNGFYHNDYLNQNADKIRAVGSRSRLLFLPTNQQWRFDLTVACDYSNEGAYPYFYNGAVSGEEQYAEYIGKITATHNGRYRRNMWNVGANISFRPADKNLTVNFISGYQNLRDRMFMDQDFITPDIFTLEQKQRQNTITEEIILKSELASGRWKQSTGASYMHQWLNTKSPVSFMSDGVDWLASTINSNFPDMSSMGMSMRLDFTNEEIVIDGDFDTPVSNCAVYHQSVFNITDRFSATVGLRLDYEKLTLDYNSCGELNYNFTFTSPKMPLEMRGLKLEPQLLGSVENEYYQLVPKFALQFKLNEKSRIYSTVSKGYRSGGYNVQMFSDVLQSTLRGHMMAQIKDRAIQTIDAYVTIGMPESVGETIKNGLSNMPVVSTDVDVKATTSYDPEYSWNYELGAHLRTGDDVKLSADMAAFFIQTRDQQIARFSTTGLGRMMVNAGKSQSLGAEFSGAMSVKKLSLFANYGYSHAKFTDYDDGNGDTNYDGNRVPFVPEQTLNAGTSYRFVPDLPALNTVIVEINYSGAGNIYWTESNTSYQDYYNTINCRASFIFNQYISFDVYGKNVTNTQYKTFYFESMSRGYYQKGKPAQLGLEVKLHL